MKTIQLAIILQAQRVFHQDVVLVLFDQKFKTWEYFHKVILFASLATVN